MKRRLNDTDNAALAALVAEVGVSNVLAALALIAARRESEAKEGIDRDRWYVAHRAAAEAFAVARAAGL